MKLRYYLRALGIGMIVTTLILSISSGNKGTLSDEEIKARAAQLGMVDNSSLTLADVQKMQESQSQGNDVQEPEKVEASEGSSEVPEVSQSTEADGDATASETVNQGETNNTQESETAEIGGNTQDSASAEGNGTEQETAPAGDSDNTQENVSAETSGNTQEVIPIESTENIVALIPLAQTSEPKMENGIEIVEITIRGGASSGTVSKALAAASLVESAVEYDNYLCNNGYSRSIRVGVHKIPVGATWKEIADIICRK